MNDAHGAAGLEVEVIGAATPVGLLAAARAALARLGVDDGHVAIELVEEEKIRALNKLHREKDEPTDVLSFPVDGVDPGYLGHRELGDVVICPQHTADLEEAVVHGVLHLCGYDHETDNGEMLALQDEVMAGLRNG